VSLLETKKVSKFFKGLIALNEVDFGVEEGTITGLIGPNGAGKTTLFNVISGEFQPTKGSIIFDGRDITRLSPDRICRMGITRTYQLVRPFLGISAFQNVLVGIYFGRTGKISKKAAEDEARELLDFMGLSDKTAYQASQLIPVERKRLEIARALATKPRLMLLDEVVSGLNPAETTRIMESIREIRENGVTIVMIEHVMKAVMGLSDKVVVLHHGIKIAEGLPGQVTTDPAVVRAYLGEGKKNAVGINTGEGSSA